MSNKFCSVWLRISQKKKIPSPPRRIRKIRARMICITAQFDPNVEQISKFKYETVDERGNARGRVP